MTPIDDPIWRYWNKHPNAVQKGAGHEVGTREFFEAVEAHRYGAEPCILTMAGFEDARGKTVLEIGCGQGTDLLQFARHGAEVHGLDYTPAGIGLARRRFQVYGLPAKLFVGDARRLPFPSDRFDVVYSHGVLMCVPEFDQCINEVHRVLKPGGRATVMVYNTRSYHYALVKYAVGPLVALLLAADKLGLGSVLRLFLPRRVSNMFVILKDEGRGFDLDRILTLSTDPSEPGKDNAHPFVRFYDADDMRAFFNSFASVRVDLRQLYKFPAPAAVKRWVEPLWGFFLYVTARKGV
ncbi:MAG: class I SAM-dependent methyltransferase [Pseudomonadota bacterium]|nr:class I SAM-dependent methyltransferase [Pseudomonadota bacterium]